MLNGEAGHPGLYGEVDIGRHAFRVSGKAGLEVGIRR
jgi:hypothetical protein